MINFNNKFVMDLSDGNISAKLKEKSLASFGHSRFSPEKSSYGRKSKEIMVVVKNQRKSKQKGQSRPKSLSTSQIRDQKSKSKRKQNELRHKTLGSQNSKSLKCLKKQHIEQFTRKVRKNNQKFIPRQNSSQSLQMRLPWGVDEPRLNNYVLETLAKMQKMRRAQCERKEDTFQTQKSQILKESDIKLQLTPKKSVLHSVPSTKFNKKVNDKVVKSPAYDENQKTDKKTIQKRKMVPEEKRTEKNHRKIQENQESPPKQKQYKVSEAISKCLTGQFQCLQKNNFYSVNFRIVSKKIIEIQLAFIKKVESLTVNLNKGSLECQSIHESYQNILPKSSIILMTAVSGALNQDKFIYPELSIMLNEKDSSFGLQKKVLLPYSWIFFLESLSIAQLKSAKLPSKIKNKSVIEQIPYRKDLLTKMQKIFDSNFIKYKIKEHLFYLYGFKIWGQMNLMRVVISGNHCLIQCESSSSANTKQILEMFQVVLGI